jgi:hypothetical protein
MRRISYTFLISLTSFFSFGQQININPSIINFHLGNPGASENQTITITNNSAELQAFEINLGDWTRTETGSHQYFAPNTQPYSCASWVRLNKNFIELKPGEMEEIVVTLQAPENPEALEKMKWAMVFIQGATLKKPEANGPQEVKTFINEIVRVGVHLYQTPFNLSKQAIKAVSLNPSKDEKNTFDFMIENDGNVMTMVKAHVELTNITTGEELVAPNADFPLFPYGKRIIKLDLPKDIKPGKYSLLAIADYGDSNPLEAIEKVIEIK